MNKFLLSSGLSILILLSFVSAGLLPVPLSGKILADGNAVQGIPVNLYINDEFVETRTSSDKGIFLFNIGDAAVAGDTIRLKVLDVEKSYVVTKEELKMGIPKTIDFDVSGRDLTPYYIGGGVIIIALGIIANYKWGKGFKKIMEKQNKATQEKMAKTIIKKDSEGAYKKK